VEAALTAACECILEHEDRLRCCDLNGLQTTLPVGKRKEQLHAGCFSEEKTGTRMHCTRFNIDTCILMTVQDAWVNMYDRRDLPLRRYSTIRGPADATKQSSNACRILITYPSEFFSLQLP